MDDVFFGDWSGLLRTLIIGALAYLVLVVFLRISGKRTLTKLNAFDLVVTVALGSTLATVLLNKSVPLADGALAFALLVGLQYVVTWLSVRVGWLRKIVTGSLHYCCTRGILCRLRCSGPVSPEMRCAQPCVHREYCRWRRSKGSCWKRTVH